MGRSMLARYDGGNQFTLVHKNDSGSDEKGTFSRVNKGYPTESGGLRDECILADTPPLVNGKFLNVAASTSPAGTVPFANDPNRELVVLFGSGDWRRTSPYLAVVWPEQVENKGQYKYWTGGGWSSNEADAAPLFDDPVFGEFSASYIPALGRWLMIYGDHGTYPVSIVFRSAPKATGPWSEKRVLLQVGDPWYSDPAFSSWYAPYIIDIFTRGTSKVTEVYFGLSMWWSHNAPDGPFYEATQVAIMRASFGLEPNPHDNFPYQYAAPAIYNDFHGYTSNITLQNISDTGNAEALIGYLSPQGERLRHLTNIQHVRANSIWQGKDMIKPGENLSASIHGNRRLGGFVNLAAKNKKLASAYDLLAADSASTELVFPFVLKDLYGWTSNWVVQNVSNQPITLSAFYSYRDKGVLKKYNKIGYVTIAPGQSHSNWQGSDNFLTGKQGSVVVQATGDMVGFCNVANTSKMLASAYNGVAAHQAASQIHFPEVRNQVDGYTSNILIHNHGDQPVRPTLTYRFDNQTKHRTLDLIEPDESLMVYQGGGVSNWYLPAGKRAAVTVSTNSPCLSGMVTDANPGKQIAYGTNAVTLAEAAETLTFSQVYHTYHNWNSRIAIQNLGDNPSSQISVQVTYEQNGSTQSHTKTFASLAAKRALWLTPSQLSIPHGLSATLVVNAPNSDLGGQAVQLRSDLPMGSAYRAAVSGE